jgi:1-acyl-sn-glycerol-3-phosphate acyltransferase
MTVCLKYIKPVSDVVLTLLLWVYYIFSYLVFFSLFYIGAFLFSRNREISFQRINHLFYRSYFFCVRALVPGLEFKIPEEVSSIRSSVIVCNHLSYLDPILLISLFEKHKTIVKNIFFKLPVFGWLLKMAGYLPASASGELIIFMVKHMENMQEYLSTGGNLFVFPEGTRSRDGRLGRFNEGAFKIAKRCNAPIKVLLIRNTERLFPPDRFFFNTCVKNTIEIELVGSIDPDHHGRGRSVSELIGQARSLLEGSPHKR